MTDEKKLSFIVPALFIAALMAGVPFWGFVVFILYCLVIVGVVLYERFD